MPTSGSLALLGSLSASFFHESSRRAGRAKRDFFFHGLIFFAETAKFVYCPEALKSCFEVIYVTEYVFTRCGRAVCAKRFFSMNRNFCIKMFKLFYQSEALKRRFRWFM